MVSACNQEKFESDYEDYYVSGSFTVDYSNVTENDNGETQEPSIEIYVEDDGDLPLLKHELCHLRQYRQNRLPSCSIPILKTLSEIECYTIQRFYEAKELFKISKKV